jgi:hypothetical protein
VTEENNKIVRLWEGETAKEQDSYKVTLQENTDLITYNAKYKNADQFIEAMSLKKSL